MGLLRAERTCHWLAEAIDDARQSHEFDLWAYVFMPEHVHLLVYPRRHAYDIAMIRKAIKAPTARRALAWLDENSPEWSDNLTRSRGGKAERLFWQSGGGYDRNVTQPATLERIVEYIHLNPVRRGLVARGSDWKWSSAASYYSKGESPLAIDPIPPEWLT